MCSMACSKATRYFGSASITPTPMDSPNTSSACVICWAIRSSSKHPVGEASVRPPTIDAGAGQQPWTGSTATCSSLKESGITPDRHQAQRRGCLEQGTAREARVMRTAYESHHCTGHLVGQYPRTSPGNQGSFWPAACGAESPDPPVFRTSSANCCRSSNRRESSPVDSWWDARKCFATSVANL